jgi:WD40 repeat protein
MPMNVQRVFFLGVVGVGLAANGSLSAGESELTPRSHMSQDEIVRCVAFSPDGKTLSSAGDDKTVRLWDVKTGKEQATLTRHTDLVWSLAYSPDGKTLASVSKDTTIKLWDLRTGKEQATLKGHTDLDCSVAFSPDSKTLAEGSKDRTIKLWDVRTAKVRATLKWHRDWLAEQVAPLPKQEVAVTYSQDGKTLASENVDKTIHLWDVATGKVRATFKEGLQGGLTWVAFSPDGKTLASTGGDLISLWDLKTGKEPIILQGHQVLSVAFSPDGKTLATGSQAGTIKLWDVKAGKERATFQGHRGAIWSVAYSPDGKTLVSGGHDKTIRLWDVRTDK